MIKTKAQLLPHSRKLLALFFGAVLLFTPGLVVSALPPPQGDDLEVSAQVPSSDSMLGATITSPASGTTTKNTIIVVKGTCEPDSTVVISSNGVMVGSTFCSATGDYEILIQLSPGRNELKARNYDSLGAFGPDTPSVIVTLETVPSSPPPAQPPSLPEKPESCSSYAPPTVTQGGRARILVVCLPSFVEADKDYEIGVLIWSGEGPYAVSVDWGDPDIEDSLFSFEQAGFHKLKFSYKQPGTYVASINLSDQSDYPAFTQVAIIVSGETNIPGLTNQGPTLNTSWFYSGIPFYVVFVALVVGFWLGDRFQHYIDRKRQ